MISELKEEIGGSFQEREDEEMTKHVIMSPNRCMNSNSFKLYK